MDHDQTPSPSLTVDATGIAWLVFDDPDRTLNVLAVEVMHRLSELLDELEQSVSQGGVRALLIRSGKARGFIAGADVSAIEAIEDPAQGVEAARLGQRVFQKVATLGVPTIAAIHGVCLGGGLELALACDHRIASDSSKTKLGLPEVMLGILPAWGGTTRLPRLVGLQAALDLLLTGRQLSGKRAKRIGLVDRIYPAELFVAKAEEFANERAAGTPLPEHKKPWAARMLEATPPGRRLVLTMARRQVMKRTGGHYPSPLAILGVLRRALSLPIERALEIEAEAMGGLITSSVSKNLIHVFNMREDARKGLGVANPEVEPREIDAIGVLGAGVMGGGIAQIAAHRGVRVRMKDIRHDAISGGLEHAHGLFNGLVKRRRLKRREAESRMELISGGLDYDGFRGLDLVVEAVVEKLDIKRIVLRETEERIRPDCTLCSNTSSLSIDAMARGLARPQNFGGMHFFNPVHKMPLVEVIRGEKTSDETVATIYAFALRLGKVPVVTRDGPGFLVNRILGLYMNEAGHLLAEGAFIEDIDKAAVDFGMPMGPLRLMDEVGLDIGRHAGQSLYEALGERMKPAAPFIGLAETERLGRKGGLGFYRYEKGKENGIDDTVYADLAGSVPTDQRRFDKQEIRNRLILSMVNEAARCLDDGIVTTAREVDLAMVMGTGFPPFRGGLLRYADSSHTRAVLDRLLQLEEAHGPRFTPAPLIVRLAESGQGFYEAFSA